MSACDILVGFVVLGVIGLAFGLSAWAVHYEHRHKDDPQPPEQFDGGW